MRKRTDQVVNLRMGIETLPYSEMRHKLSRHEEVVEEIGEELVFNRTEEPAYRIESKGEGLECRSVTMEEAHEALQVVLRSGVKPCVDVEDS